MKKTTLVALCLALAASFKVSAVEYWVATTGDDTAPGTQQEPFATLTNALAHAADGVVVKVMAGTYKLPVTTSRTVGATSHAYGTPSFWLTNAVTVIGVDGPEATIFDGENRANCYAFCLDNPQAEVSGVTVQRVKTSIPYQWAESPVFEVKNGFLTNCIARDCALYYVGGINLRKGALCECQVLNCSCSDDLSQGAGINLSVASGTPGITNCIVSGCSGVQGPALYAPSKTPKVYGCVFRNNTTKGTGRGGLAPVYVTGGTLENCIITNNTSQTSGANVGGGGLRLAGATVRNCLIAGNKETTAIGGGGVYMTSGTLENCTVVGNYMTAATHGHGVYQTGGTIRNCIISHNTPDKALHDIENHYRTVGTVVFTCTYPEAEGESNNTEDPDYVDLFGDDYRLAPASTLFDIGTNQIWMAGAKDLDSTARIANDIVNLGCYEGATPLERPFGITANANLFTGAKPLAVSFTLTLKHIPDVNDVTIAWSFGDSGTSAEQNPVHVYQNFGTNWVKVIATSAGKSATNIFVNPIIVGTDTIYINHTGSGSWPFDTPAKGTNDIILAMKDLYAPANGDPARVFIVPGKFYPGETIKLLTQPVHICGDQTQLSCSMLADKTSGVIHMNHPGCLVSGIEFTDMSVAASYALYGGALTIAQGIASNCLLSGYSSSYTLGPLRMTGGTFTDGLIYNCSNGDSGAGGGGRAGFIIDGKDAMLVNTVISNCTATCVGGGELKSGTISNCLFYSCTASTDSNNSKAGALLISGAGKVYHTRFIANTYPKTSSIVGGIVSLAKSGALLRNCLINCSTSGVNPAVRLESGTIESCTVTDNRLTSATATDAAGIAFADGTLLNTIIWNNTDAHGDQHNLSGQATALNCCTSNPFFKNPAAFDYRLTGNSMNCIDKGDKRAWMEGATDLDGNARVFGNFARGKVDIGAYEYQSGFSSLFLVR
ncbi:MAG: hypothetical protein GX174_03440 [Lentisphaerae bacterium]|nr:hypothetical protein [Lentisphaerota bacterium]